MSPASRVTGRSASPRNRQTPAGPPTPVISTRGRDVESGDIGLDHDVVPFAGTCGGKCQCRLTVTDDLEGLSVPGRAEAAPVAGGGAQKVLLQVATDLDLGAVGADDLELALDPVVDP